MQEALRDSRLVTLTGPGGVGKTRLAQEVGERESGALDGGVAVVDLSDVEDALVMASAVAEQLELVIPADAVSVTDVLAGELGSEPRLLVLDNCELLVDTLSELVSHLLAPMTGLRILATSRQPLGVPGEVVWRLDPLAVPGDDPGEDPAGIGHVPAVRLFVDRARAADRHFRLEEGNAAAVAAICRRVDGLPLAIELAAAWTATLSVGEIAERLERDLGLLRSTPGGRHRQETLRAVFARSYSLLTDGERAVFDRLGPFAGFGAEAAQAVCGPAIGDATDVVEVLARLVDKSLLVVGRHAGRARYRQLAPARSFGSELLQGLADARDVRRRHAEWFVALAESGLAEPDPKTLRDLEIEHGNFSSALTWADRGDPELARRLFAALRPFWETGGRVGEGLRWADALVGGTPPGGKTADPGILNRALETAGGLALAVGEHGRARAWLESALSGFRTTEDQPGAGRVLARLGVLARYRGEIREAERLLLEAAGRLAGEPAEAACLAELGHVTALSGREVEGERLLLRSLDLARVRNDLVVAADALNYLGKLAAVRGALEVAERHHEQALEMQREMNTLRAEARTLGLLGEIAWRRREFDRSRSLYERALDVQRRFGDQRGMARSLGHLAFVEYQLGHPTASAALYRQVLELRRRMQDRRGQAGALVGLATAIWLGDPSDIELEEARLLADEGVVLHRSSGDPRALAWALYTQAEIARDQGDVSIARAAAGEALDLHRRLGEPEWTTLGLHTLATLALADGDLAEARSLLTEATGMALAAGVPLQQLRCVEVAAHLVLAEGHPDLSVLLYGAARAGRQALDQPPPRRAQRTIADADVASLRGRLPARAFGTLWDEGMRLSIDQACGLVLDAGVTPALALTTGEKQRAREWSIRLLGDVVVEAAGRRVPLPGRAPAQVLKVVALRRRIQVDELVELLWPDAPPGVGRRRFNNLLARLRRATGNLVVRDGDTLSLVSEVEVDVDTFTAAADAALAAVGAGLPEAEPLCRRAAELYRGELLPADRYEDWAAAPRVRLARLHLDILDALAEGAAGSGRRTEAVQWLERGIDAEPLDLARYRRAVDLMLVQGWQHRARGLARRARRVSDELGVELPADLARLLSG